MPLTWNQIGNTIKKGYNGLLNIWNDIQGVNAEKQNTQETNQANLAMTEATNQANYKIAQEANQVNRDITSQTNAMNYDVAMQNLGFQRELQEYQKALQKEIFEREDTSYQRTAKDMMAAGLNPLSMQGTNGSGEAIAISPLNNSFQAQQSSPMQAAQMQSAQFQKATLPIMTGNQILSSITGLMEGINQLKTGQLQRDALQLQNDKQYIENHLLANDNGLIYQKGDYKNKNNALTKIYPNGEYSTFDLRGESKRYEYINAMREFEHKVAIGRYDSDTDIEKMFTAIMDWSVNGRSEEQLNKLREKYPLIDMAISMIKGFKK